MIRARVIVAATMTVACLTALARASFSQTQKNTPPAVVSVTLNGAAGGDRFDGIGAVSGGGATTDLLKDYPLKQRNEVLDLLFKPDFGASISSLYVEVPGDGNSTQGTEPSHMHTRNDLNYYRGYEWWLMSEAKKRNPALSLDACAWSAPGWVGNGNFWSQDMCDYYVKWIQGLKSAHGLTLDAIGCRNEKGVNEDFIKMFRQTLDNNGLSAVKLHGFDNWGPTQWDWVPDMLKDPELEKSVDILSNHTIRDNPTPPIVDQVSKEFHKPIWNTEEHVYESGFKDEMDIVKAFNDNYIQHGVTSIVNWFLVGSVYDTEPYGIQPAMMVANSPWSGAFRVRDALWGYAHYGQFTKIGWEYLHGGCGELPNGGGSYVTLKSPKSDYSVIAETEKATGPQTMTFHIAGGLSNKSLCVWRSNAKAQFTRLADIQPINGTFTLTLDPNSIYSLSTTRGQRKGEYVSPAQKPFPFPYYETFDHYQSAKSWGYLPHYTADIVGVFELAERPDLQGQCLRQVISQKADSWAPEWMPYTVIGDSQWRDYEVSSDVCMDDGGMVGVLGRVTNTGDGYHNPPLGYTLTVDQNGQVQLSAASRLGNNAASTLLASGTVPPFELLSWHNLKLKFVGSHITGYVDGKQIVSADNTLYEHGMAGLLTGGLGDKRNTADFDNLVIKAPGAPNPLPTVFAQDKNPLYH